MNYVKTYRFFFITWTHSRDSLVANDGRKKTDIFLVDSIHLCFANTEKNPTNTNKTGIQIILFQVPEMPRSPDRTSQQS